MKVLIIANRAKSAKNLNKLISMLSKDIEEVAICNSLNEGKDKLKSDFIPDLIFNICEDIADEYFKVIQESNTLAPLVFIADNDRFMASSFLFNTIHFITDKVKIEDVKFCFDKFTTYHKVQPEANYVKDLQKLTQLLSEKEKEYKKRFMVKIGKVIRSVNVDDIAYLFSQDRINYLVKYNGKKFPIDNSLDEIEELLDPEVFFRANRQFIVNIDSIAEIHPYFKGRVKLNLEPQQDGDLVISADKSRSFKNWLDE